MLGRVVRGSRTWMCTMAAPALAASIADSAICWGVTGTAGFFPGVSADPVTAHDIITLRCMVAPASYQSSEFTLIRHARTCLAAHDHQSVNDISAFARRARHLSNRRINLPKTANFELRRSPKGAAMTQPLSGILVLDFTTLLPGPLATLMLAEAGAEVIKIERPGGEELRRHPPHIDGASVPFALLNRGKRSLVLDLKSRDDQARLATLIARADILVEQFRPGVMERLGLGYAAVRRANPRIVYCSISGYGQRGPRAH